MERMEKKILTDGQVLPGEILKVGSFLNQQLDVELLTEAGKEIASLFAGEQVNRVVTIESSGIAIAVPVAQVLKVPVTVIKKSKSANQSGDLYSAEIFSYTHGNSYLATVAKDYIREGDRVLFVDDFLATGNAIQGVRKIIRDAGAVLAGCAFAVEKGFQGGGDALRNEGIHVESLAIVDSMSDDGGITFRP